MKSLSISAAWDESKAILAREGRLLLSVALAMVALPTAVNSLVNPAGLNSSSGPLWVDLVTVVASLVALAGQLALVRLAIGPSITVGGAIAHGVRRMPVYLAALVMVVVALMLAAVPLILILAALGVPIQGRSAGVPPSPATLILALFYFVLICFVGVRLILSAPIASAEHAGPIAILQRSWRLTAGNFWPLFGFLLAFVVMAIILLVAIASAAGVVIGMLFGTIGPMTAAALVLALVQALVSAGVTTVFAVMLARIYLQLAGRSDVQASVPSSGI